MTSSQTDDLSFVRQMAEAGRNAPLLGGRFFVFYGVLIPIAYAVQWMVLSGEFGLPYAVIGWNWLAFGAAVAVGMPLLLRTIRRKPGRGTAGNRAEAAAWMFAGFTIGAFFLGVLIANLIGATSQIAFDYILAVAFTGYGIALFVTASLAGTSWLKVPAYISMASVGIVPVLAGRPDVYLFGATVVLLVSLYPGIRLMMAEPKSLPAEDA
ncbi:hypothetical protein [Parvularcula lutaonensis]|uniref:Uncharacterized protein n=1 Tax=Parvularcula lutaonensis TaxID=491923 RepID=A0ABV7M9J5_9PROT|nr:hypothetical protein [Parvularcula lutaonensis]GGY46916.1 hypothetical protein GCM10007148_15130 [Parvularcula lutaonensis]